MKTSIDPELTQGCVRITTLLCSVCTRVERLRMPTLSDKRMHHSSVELINNLSPRALSAVYVCDGLAAQLFGA